MVTHARWISILVHVALPILTISLYPADAVDIIRITIWTAAIPTAIWTAFTGGTEFLVAGGSNGWTVFNIFGV